jgi:hypothetical protein
MAKVKRRPVVRGPQLALRTGRVPAMPAPRALTGAPELSTKQQRAIRAKARGALVEAGIYRQQFVKCGKAACLRCKRGPVHGPYWFVEWYEGASGDRRRRMRTRYVGKRLPTAEIAAYVMRTGSPEAAAAAAEELSTAERGA